MAHVLSSPDRTLLRTYPQTLRRYLCFAPRVVLATAQVNGTPVIDPVNGGVFKLPYDNDDIGDTGILRLNYTIDVGTTPGAHDVGQYRLRKGIDLSGHFIPVNETAQGTVPVADNHYLTFIQERKIWQKRIHRVITSIDPPDYNEFTDYDIGYGGENEAFYPPIPNITRDHFKEHAVKRVGRVDPGQTTRTINLSAFCAESPINAITNYFWHMMFADGLHDDIIVGYPDFNALTSVDIVVHMPVGTMIVELDVLTATGRAHKYLRLWTFPETDDHALMITEFTVDRDTRAEGREMSFTINDAKAADIGKGVELCYWEEAEFGGAEPPEQYIWCFNGWATKDATLLSLNRSVYKLDVGGPKTWLDLKGGYPQTVYDQRTIAEPTRVSTKYIEMPHNTPDRMVHYLLRIYTNALELINLYLSDYQEPIEGYTSDSSSIWNQISAVTERYFGNAACDSNGTIWLVRNYQYKEQSERDGITPILIFDNRDWLDNSPPEISIEAQDKVAIVDIYGSNYDVNDATMVDSSHLWRANAPGVVQGDGTGTDTPASQFLKKGSVGLDQLLRLSGHHLARLNNKIPDIGLSILGNQDVIEPAWGEPIAVNYVEPNIRGIQLINKRALVKSIDVKHSNDFNKPPKSLTFSLETETIGFPGLGVEVIQREYVQPYVEPPQSILTAGTKAIGLLTRGGVLRFIYDIDTDTPSLVSHDISGTIPNPFAVVPDPYSPYYLGAGTEINLHVADPQGNIYLIEDVTGLCTITQQHTGDAGYVEGNFTGVVIQFERGVQNWGMALYDKTVGFNTQPRVAYTQDGVNWNLSEETFGNGIAFSLHVSPHTPGLGYITLGNTLFKTLDYGATWDTDTIVNINGGGILHVPYQSTDDGIAYSGYSTAITRSDHGSDTNITPIFSGYSHAPYAVSVFPLKTCDINQNIVLFASRRLGIPPTYTKSGLFYSTDQGDNWQRVVFEDGIDPNLVGCNIAGDNGRTIFAWGVNYFGWTDDPDDVIYNRSAGFTGEALNIWGIPNTP